ncbi:hypothetical protein ACIQF6_06015 [Kitasatospora sp. NPDC092948]|uniref:hypothetical protein n=1 Tax=Kitasatospora sp. NPDC092948 TaxID=3364088 RepID=UPI00382CA7FE
MGWRRLRAVRGAARLRALLAVPVLAWAVSAAGPIEWERTALVLGLLRLCQEARVEWCWVDLR